MLRYVLIDIVTPAGALPARVLVTENAGLHVGQDVAARYRIADKDSLTLRHKDREVSVDIYPCNSGMFMGKEIAEQLGFTVHSYQEKQGEACHVQIQEGAISEDLCQVFCDHIHKSELTPIGEKYRTTLMAELGEIEALTHRTLAIAAEQFIEPFYNLEIESWEKPQLIVYHEGGVYGAHADGSHWVRDAEGNDIGWERFLDRDISLLMYFNEDFTGRKLDFPDLNLKITPKPGLLTTFPSSHSYRHGAEPTESGERILLVTWMRAVGTPRTWPKPMTRFKKKDYL